MKITQDIFLLCGSMFSSVGNKESMGEAYGIVNDTGIVLIDCGKSEYSLENIYQTLNSFDIEKRITHCIITHAHNDHCGNAKRLQEKGVKIIVGKEDYEYCINGGPKKEETPYYQEQQFQPFIPDKLIDSDETITINGIEFELIKVPGHTNGSLAIRTCIRGKWILFTGDILQPNGMLLDEMNFGWKGDPYYDSVNIYKSIRKLSSFRTDIILPGHGKICLQNGSVLLEYAMKKAYMLTKN